jgi:hypothetical protein
LWFRAAGFFVLKLWPKGGCANVKKRWKKRADFCCFFSW